MTRTHRWWRPLATTTQGGAACRTRAAPRSTTLCWLTLSGAPTTGGGKVSTRPPGSAGRRYRPPGCIRTAPSTVWSTMRTPWTGPARAARPTRCRTVQEHLTAALWSARPSTITTMSSTSTRAQSLSGGEGAWGEGMMSMERALSTTSWTRTDCRRPAHSPT